MLKVVLDLVNITGASLRNPRLFEALLFAVRILAAVANTSHAGEPSPGDGFCVLGFVFWVCCATTAAGRWGANIVVVVEVGPFLLSSTTITTTFFYSKH